MSVNKDKSVEGGGQENGKKVVTPDSIDKKKKMKREMKEEGKKWMNEWEKSNAKTCKVQMRGYYNWVSDNSLNKEDRN